MPIHEFALSRNGMSHPPEDFEGWGFRSFAPSLITSDTSEKRTELQSNNGGPNDVTRKPHRSPFLLNSKSEKK